MSTDIEPTSAPVLTVADVVARVRHRPLWLLIPVVVGIGAAVAYAVLAPKTYVAVASVQVQPVVSDQYGSVNIANVLNMATEEQVATSSSVTGLAAAALGTTSDQVQAALSVDSPQDTQVLNVRYSARDAGDAARGAQTVAEKYLEYRASSTKQDAQRRLDDVNQQIASDEAKLRARAGSETGPLQGDLQSLLSARRQLVAIQNTPVGRVLTAASVPLAPSSPRLTTDVPLGLAGGVLVGLGLALLLPGPERHQPVARTTAPRRARDAGGKPSEFDQMLLAAQTTGRNGLPFRSAAGPAAAPPALPSVAAGAVGNGGPASNGTSSAGAAAASNGEASNGAGASAATPIAGSSSRS